MIHSYCSEFDYSSPIDFTIDRNGNIDLPGYATGGYLQDGHIDSGGRVSGLSITVQSRSLGTLDIPYSGTDDDGHFSVSGTSVNGITSTIQADMIRPLPSVSTVDNGDGTHSVTGSGDDLTLHSVGNDVMTGGGVRERFVFTPGFGQSEITDFVAGGQGHDIVDLSATHYDSLAQVLRHTSMSDGSATIHLNRHDSITLDGVTKGQISHNPQAFAFHG